MINDEFYMDLAIKEAWKYQILTYPNPPVGSLILDKYGKILALKAHEKAGSPHAELNAIFSALYKNSNFRSKFDAKFSSFSKAFVKDIYDFIL
ncbi:MAG: riboflavin biosynthesis protein RibD, partial [Campylobacter sp.]|nr:riboflavin biosynthesis protein RibD [Campylobacter sp.]